MSDSSGIAHPHRPEVHRSRDRPTPLGTDDGDLEEGSSMDSLADDEDYNMDNGSGSGDALWEGHYVEEQEMERQNAERLLIKPGWTIGGADTVNQPLTTAESKKTK